MKLYPLHTYTVFAALISSFQINAATIATLGFGVDPSISATSNQIETGFDFVHFDDIPEDNSIFKQGTALIQDLHQLAPNSQLSPLKVSDQSSGWDLSRGEAAINLILQRNDIKVVDFPSLQPVNTGRLQQAVQQGAIIIIDAGNGAQNSPSNQARAVPLLNGGGIIVGAVDHNLLIHPTSNRAGDLAKHYIVAPASSIHSPIQNTTFSRIKVSAAAARLFETAPNLSPTQVANILFNTATDLGAIGVDPIYGNGLLNVQRALSPQGLTSIGGDDTGATNSGGGSGGAAIGALVVAGAVGYALTQRSRILKKTLVLDQYERPYQIDLTARSTKLGQATMPTLLGFTHLSNDSIVNQSWHNQSQLMTMQLYPTAHHSKRPLHTSHTSFELNEESDVDGQWLWQSKQLNGNELLFALNQNIAPHFGATTSSVKQFNLSSQAFSSPFFSFAQHGISLKLGQEPTSKNDLIKTQFGFSSQNDPGRHGAQSQAALFGGVIKKEQGSMGLQIGYIHEDGSLFGSASSGPLSVNSAKTLSLTLSGEYKITPRFTLVGSYSQGRTSVNAASGSLLTQFTTLSSQSAAMGLLAQSIWMTDDQLSLTISQPLSITSGQVNIHTPTKLDHRQQVLFEDETVNLGFTKAPETRFELVYNRAIFKSLNWQSKLLYRNGSYLSDASGLGVSIQISKQF